MKPPFEVIAGSLPERINPATGEPDGLDVRIAAYALTLDRQGQASRSHAKSDRQNASGKEVIKP
jgi:hypothetical protein